MGGVCSARALYRGSKAGWVVLGLSIVDSAVRLGLLKPGDKFKPGHVVVGVLGYESRRIAGIVGRVCRALVAYGVLELVKRSKHHGSVYRLLKWDARALKRVLKDFGYRCREYGLLRDRDELSELEVAKVLLCLEQGADP